MFPVHLGGDEEYRSERYPSSKCLRGIFVYTQTCLRSFRLTEIRDAGKFRLGEVFAQAFPILVRRDELFQMAERRSIAFAQTLEESQSDSPSSNVREKQTSQVFSKR